MWAKVVRGVEGRLDKRKRWALPSPSHAPSKRVQPAPSSLSSPLWLSPIVFSPLSGRSLDMDLGCLQECLEQVERERRELADPHQVMVGLLQRVQIFLACSEEAVAWRWVEKDWETLIWEREAAMAAQGELEVK